MIGLGDRISKSEAVVRVEDFFRKKPSTPEVWSPPLGLGEGEGGVPYLSIPVGLSDPDFSLLAPYFRMKALGRPDQARRSPRYLGLVETVGGLQPPPN